MNSEIFKGATEAARSLHRTILLASLVLAAVLLPNVFNGSIALWNTIALTTSLYAAYIEKGYNYAAPVFDGTVSFVMDLSGQKDFLNVFERYTQTSFEYDVGGGRSLPINIQLTRLTDKVDADFIFSKEIRDLWYLSTRNLTGISMDGIVSQRLRPISMTSLPPDRSFGEVRPRWMRNIVGLFPNQLSTISDAARFLYILSKLDSFTILKPDYATSQITIYDKIKQRELPLKDIDLEGGEVGLPLKCNRLSQGRVCSLQFGGYDILFNNSVYKIRSQLENESFSVVLSADTKAYTIEIDKNWCHIFIRSDCSSIIALDDVVSLVGKYGDLPLDGVMNVFRAVNNASQSLQIVGASINGLRWICLLGSWIIAVLCCCLSISLNTAHRGLLTNELRTYAEIMPDTWPGAAVAISSIALLPTSAVILSVTALLSEDWWVILASALAAIITLGACAYSIVIVLAIYRYMAFSSIRSERIDSNDANGRG